MKYVLGGVVMASLAAGMASAGGIERARPAGSILFENGNYVQFSFSQTDGDVSGKHPAFVGGGGTGDIANAEEQFGFGLKLKLSEQLDFAISLANPYGADAAYGEGFYEGLTAQWNSTSIDAILKYNVNERISVFGGASMLTSLAEINIPLTLANIASDPDGPASAGGGPRPGTIVSDYVAKSSGESDFGYILGAAYQIPDIALRVALTYRSAITHDFEAQESYTQLGFTTTAAPVFTPVDTTTDFSVEMPQSLTLDFQSGVAPKTLVFGSVKWTEWSKWAVRPTAYESETGDEIVSFENDVFTYQLGVGRQITDNLSLFVRAGYETKKGGTSSRLSPTDGYTSVGFGGSYTHGNAKFSAGIEHAWLGEAETSTPTNFKDNTATGFGFSVGFSF